MVGLIYRPPKPNRLFIQEFSEFLSEMSTKHDRFLLLGDFNVHICYGKDTLSSEFRNLIESFDLVQWVNSPTHNQGHMLDLVLNHTLQIKDVKVCGTNFSDHMPITFNNSTTIQPVLLDEAERRWKKNKLQVHYESFRDSLFKFQKATTNAKKYIFFYH